MDSKSVVQCLVKDCRNLLEVYPRAGDEVCMDRLICRWNEKLIDSNIHTIHSHIYAVGITKDDRVYQDCRKRLIFCKILISTTLRPLHAAIKVLYHASMFPVAKAIFLALSGKIGKLEACNRSIESISDIFRTPLHEVAMILVGLQGITMALIDPINLYKARERIAKLEVALLRSDSHPFTLTPCFQSGSLEDLIEEYGISMETKKSLFLSNFDDTDYGQYSLENLRKEGIVTILNREEKFYYKIENDLDERQINIARNALANRAMIHRGRAMIKIRRKHYNPLFQIFGRLSPLKTYISVAYSKVLKA